MTERFVVHFMQFQSYMSNTKSES